MRQPQSGFFFRLRHPLPHILHVVMQRRLADESRHVRVHDLDVAQRRAVDDAPGLGGLEAVRLPHARRQPLGGQDPDEGQLGPHPDGPVLVVEEILGDGLGVVGDGERLDLLVPILPEFGAGLGPPLR